MTCVLHAMLKTTDSKPPSAWTQVLPDDQGSVDILAEIKLYLSAHNSLWLWEHSIDPLSYRWNAWPDLLRPLVTAIFKLPSEYDLLSDGRITSYSSRYASYSSSAADRQSRPVILSNVTSLLAYMEGEHDRLLAATPYSRRPEYERLYAATTAAFDAWLAVARAKVIPSQRSMRQREESGPRRGRARPLKALLSEMKDLAHAYA